MLHGTVSEKALKTILHFARMQSSALPILLRSEPIATLLICNILAGTEGRVTGKARLNTDSLPLYSQGEYADS